MGLKGKARARFCRTLQALVRIWILLYVHGKCLPDSEPWVLMLLPALLILSKFLFSGSCPLLRHLHRSLPDPLWGHANSPHVCHFTHPPTPATAASASSSWASSPSSSKRSAPGSRACSPPKPLKLIRSCLPSIVAGQRSPHNSATEPKGPQRLDSAEICKLHFYKFLVGKKSAFVCQQSRGLIFFFHFVFCFFCM